MEEQTINWQDYFIIVDSYEWALYEKKVNKTKGHKNYGKEYDQLLGHFSRFENLLQKLLRIETTKKGSTFDMDEYIRLWAELSERLVKDLEEKFQLKC